jgi:hypothetical protein
MSLAIDHICSRIFTLLLVQMNGSGGGDKLQNPFDGGGQDFLGFTASTPRGSPSGGRGFRPRHGKHNRRDNWQRFGEFEANQRGRS